MIEDTEVWKNGPKKTLSQLLGTKLAPSGSNSKMFTKQMFEIP